MGLDGTSLSNVGYQAPYFTPYVYTGSGIGVAIKPNSAMGNCAYIIPWNVSICASHVHSFPMDFRYRTFICPY